MGVYIGVDLHVRTQTVCWMDSNDGEVHERTLEHERDDVRDFYAQLAAPAVVGVEASGYSLWFHRLIEESGHRLLVGNTSAIRQFARRRQKNDQRDAQLLLDLLLHGDFPAVHVPSPASRDVLALLRYRHRLVRMRAMLRNGLQAVALSHQLRLGPRLFTVRGQQQLTALPLTGAYAAQREHSLALLDSLGERVRAIEQELERRAQQDARVVRLRTHSGVGLLTGVAVVHALEPVARFDRARRIAAYCGLGPQRAFQWRHPALRPHLQAGQPPAAVPAGGGGAQRHPRRGRSAPLLLSAGEPQELGHCSGGRSAKAGVAVVSHAA